jgi:hypothetical protein
MSSPSTSWTSLSVYRNTAYWVNPLTIPVTAAWTGSSLAQNNWLAFKTTYFNPTDSPVVVTGLWGCDNDPGLILVNGLSFPTFAGTNWYGLSPFNFTASPGSNTIVFTVRNLLLGDGGIVVAFINAIATSCAAGTFSSLVSQIPLSVTCIPCTFGTYSSSNGSITCQQCPGGHYCPAGTSSWARLNCGRGNYCPDGSGAPTPCPYQVPPSGGWGALQVQGPAFLVETAHCLNHCFWNFTSGDGMLSKC